MAEGMNSENRSFGFLYKFLGLFTKVHPGEAATLLLLALTGFLVLGASLVVVRLTKTLENSTRHSLFLVTSREEK